MGVELPLRVVVTILECCVTFSGVKLSIRSFVLLLHLQNEVSKVSFLKFPLKNRPIYSLMFSSLNMKCNMPMKGDRHFERVLRHDEIS